MVPAPDSERSVAESGFQYSGATGKVHHMHSKTLYHQIREQK